MKPWNYFKSLKSLVYTHAGMNADYSIVENDGKLFVSFEKTSGSLDWLFNLLFIPIFILIPFTVIKLTSVLSIVFIVLGIIELVCLIIFCVKYFPKKPYKRMESIWRVHFGIALLYGSIRDEVMSKIKEYVEKGITEIYVGGWSQGGGVAIMCVEDIFYQTGIKPTLTTFGAPRVPFGKKSKERIENACGFNSNCYENSSDVVPHLPLLIWGFKSLCTHHIGERFNIFKIFKTAKWHTDYGNEELYK